MVEVGDKGPAFGGLMAFAASSSRNFFFFCIFKIEMTQI